MKSLTVSELRVMVDVDDLRKVRHFYLDLLGVTERTLDDPEDGIAMFELGEGRVIEFFEESTKERPTVELSLEVEDVTALWKKLEGAATIVFPLRHNSWGDTSFAVKDPAGCTLTFFTRDEKREFPSS